MKHLFWLLLLVSGIASAQFTPTGSKTRFVNGIGLGTKLDAAFGTVDSLVLYAKADSTLMFKYKGTARALAYASDLSIYKLANDSSYNTGWTSRLQSKRLIDSLAATKQSLFTQGLNGSIPKWTSASGLDTSQIRQEGGNILIGGAINNGYKLSLLGTIQVQGDAGFTGSLAISSRLLSGGAVDDGLNSLQVLGSSKLSADLSVGGLGNYITNKASSYTARSFTDKNYVDSSITALSIGSYKLANDSSFNSGYTTRITTKNKIDSLGATKQPIFTQGLSGYFPKWTGANTQDTSQIRQIGGSIHILQRLNVNGAADNSSYPLNVTGNGTVSGGFGIGSTALSQINLRLSKNITGGGATSAYGIRQDGIVQNDVTNSSYGIYNSGNIAAGASLNFYYHFYAGQQSFGITPSKQIGYYVESSLTGATSNYGFQGAIASGANRFNLYMDGTASNYLRGVTMIGTSSTDDGINQLQVTGSIKSSQYRLSTLNTAPSSASDTGTLGEIRIDANYIYICTATNTWKRVAIATW
jgi:hypothetical protein